MKAYILKILLLGLFYNNMWGQQDLYADYIENHHSITNFDISGDAEWITYIKNYDKKEDTLIIQNLKRNKAWEIPEGLNLKFATGKFFNGGFLKNDSIVLFNLNGKEKISVQDVDDFFFLKDKLVVISQKENGTSLKVFNQLGRELLGINSISAYQFNPTKNAVIFLNEERDILSFIDLKNLNIQKLLKSLKNTYHKITWSKSGNAIGFLENFPDGRNNKIHLIKDIKKNPKYENIRTSDFSGYSEGLKVDEHIRRKFYISEDEKRIFFSLYTEKETDSLPKNIYIWNSGSPDKITQDLKPPGHMQHDEAVWDIEEKTLFKFTEETHRGAIPIPNSTFILVYSGDKYKPNYKYGNDYLDFTIIDYRTGKIITEIKKQPYEHFFTMVSPNGKFISYFKEKDWWIYDIKNDKHNNITSNFSVPLHDIQYDWSGIATPYGNPGWTSEDAKVIIYDEFDIWLVSPDGNTRTKMTHGRESETEFRIYKEQKSRNNSITFFGFENKTFDFGKKLVLYAFNKKTKESGYFTLLQDQALEKIVFKSSNLWGLRSAKNNDDNYIYIQENYHHPRQLNLIKDGKETTLYKSNPITRKLALQEPELISYSCLGEELQGILYYPSNFNTHKKYPMITSIYERKSDGLNNYIKPGENNTGFNIRDYNQEGYFVLYPDIKYKVNDPGNSAAKCVAEAVSEALKNKFISRKNLGLQGHSFGGYQTSFILTKTDLFKTAIASGGYHDLVRFYFSLDEYHKTSSFWRFEWHQQRIEGGFYENKNDFLSNSTLQHADKINTPLLIWAGKNDDIINWEQSLALHFGLNRLGKKNSLLIYEEEGHMIMDDKNRKDIRSRTKSWFDYYLKGGKKPKWINH